VEAALELRAVRDRLVTAGRPDDAAELAVAIGRLRLAGGGRRAALVEVDRFLADDPLDAMDPLDRPYIPVAHFYAEAGRPARARQLVAAFMTAVPTGYQARYRGALERTWAAIHLAEGRPREALQAVQQAAREYPSGYVSYDASLIGVEAHPELARAYDRAGFPDSAIAVYERFLAVPAVERVQLDAFELPNALFRLAELYQRRGSYAEAAGRYLRFAALWKNADPALQPRVTLARRRAAALGQQRGHARVTAMMRPPPRRARPRSRVRWAASRSAAVGRPRIAQGDLTVDLERREYPRNHQGCRNRENFVASQLSVPQRGLHGLLDLALRRDPEVLEKLAELQIEDALIHRYLPGWDHHDASERRALRDLTEHHGCGA
jgi:tetratricopeptide (TPR) repeat protein